MGSFPGCCAFSGLSIHEGDEAVMFLLKETKTVLGHRYTPASPPIRCRYQDSGPYKALEPVWYLELVAEAVCGYLGASWSAVDAKNVPYSCVHQGVYDVLTGDPDRQDKNAEADIRAMGKLLRTLKATTPREFDITLRDKLLLYEPHLAETPLGYKLQHDLEGSVGGYFWLSRYIVPAVGSSRRLTHVLRGLMAENEINAVMRATNRPWSTPDHTAAQEGNAGLVGYMYERIATVAWKQQMRQMRLNQP